MVATTPKGFLDGWFFIELIEQKILDMKYILLIVVTVLFCSSVMAQNAFSHFSVSTEPLYPFVFNPLMSPQESDAMFDTLSQKAVFVFELEDSTATAIEITLGSAQGLSDKYSASININGNALPQGVVFERRGHNIRVVLPAQKHLNHFYASAKVLLANGSYSRLYETKR